MPDEMFEKVKKENENETGTKGETRVSSAVVSTNSSSTSKRGGLSHR